MLVCLGNDPNAAIEMARRTSCRVYQQVTAPEALATVRAAVSVGVDPKIMGVGPIPATRKA